MTKILTFGVFDYFHLGHLRLFQKCREYGDYLIVGIQSSEYAAQCKPDQTLFYNTEERLEMIQALRIVDEAFVYDTLCPATMEIADFDILALGEGHKGGRFDVIGKWCYDHKKSVIRINRTPRISSSQIRETILKLTSQFLTQCRYGDM